LEELQTWEKGLKAARQFHGRRHWRRILKSTASAKPSKAAGVPLLARYEHHADLF